MIETLTKRKTNFKWVGHAPGDTHNLAVIIPQFNEATSNAGFQARLNYFNTLGLAHQHKLDIIIIDDGSSDESLLIIDEFQKSTNCSFYVAAVYPNSDKVGAIFLTISEIEHPYVVLTDFDTDIVGLEKIFNYIGMFSTDPNLLGGYFRMLPFEGSGPVFFYQQLEYSLARGLYVYHQSDKSVPVMPGAGLYSVEQC